MKDNLLKLRLQNEFSPIMFDIYAAAPDCYTIINWLDLNKPLVIHIIQSTEENHCYIQYDTITCFVIFQLYSKYLVE